MSGKRVSAEAVDAWRELLVYVRRATGVLDADLCAGSGLGLDDYDVLYQVSRGPRAGMRMSALAASLVVAASSCTRHVGDLVERGWVERRPDPVDGRVVVVTLTPAGRRVLRRAAIGHLRAIDRIFATPLGEAGVRQLHGLLEDLGETSPEGLTPP